MDGIHHTTEAEHVAAILKSRAKREGSEEVPVLRDSSLFQQLLDGDALLAALRLDLFDLFSCKHILSLC